MTVSLRHIFAWILLLGIFSSVYWMCVRDDIATVQELEDSYARKKMLLDKLLALPERERLIKSRLADLGGEAAHNELYQGEANSVQAYIQRDVREIASNIGLHITKMRPLSSVLPNDILHQVSIQLHFATTYEQFLKFQDALQQFQPMLRVQRLSVRIQRASTVSQAAQLSISMDLSGYRLNEKRRGKNE